MDLLTALREARAGLFAGDPPAARAALATYRELRKTTLLEPVVLLDSGSRMYGDQYARLIQDRLDGRSKALIPTPR